MRLVFFTYLSFALFFLLTPNFNVLAQQVTIYDANFSGNGSRSGSASGQVGGSWSATPRSGDCVDDSPNGEFFGTRNGSFEITNFEGSGCTNGQGGNNDSEWRTNPINIRNYTNISVIVELSGTAGGGGFEGNPNRCFSDNGACVDQIRVSVSVDGESFSSTYRPNTNSFNETFDEAQGVCGNQLFIRVLGGTQGSDESFFIDRVLVTGERGGKPSPQNATIDRCVGEDATLRIVNVSNNAQIEWIDNEGDEIPSARNRITLTINDVQEDDTGLYAALVLDPDAGCSTPIFLEYELFVLPGLSEPASLKMPESVTCVGESVNLIASPNGDGFEYAWAGPDGEEIVECRNSNVCPIENAKLADAGAYLVILGNPDAGFCALGEAENTLEVIEGPGEVNSIETQFSSCEGESIELEINTSNSGEYSYIWQNPDGTQQQANGTDGSLIINDIQENDAGFYQLLVSNLDGSCAAELNNGTGINVLVSEGIEPPTIISLGDACDALSTLQVESESSQRVAWFNENDELVAENTNTFLPTVAGSYYAIISDENTDCQSPRSELFLVELGTGVTAIVQAEREQVCPRTRTTLTASGGTQFLWSTGATTSSIEAFPGMYEVTVTNAEGCSGTTTFTLEAFPNFEIDITGEAQICTSETSTLTASGGSQYRWSTNATSPIIQVGAGNYNVTITSENGCEKVANYTVEEFPDFEVNITGETQICEGETSTLTASGGSQYRWNTNATSPSIQVDAGNYSVTITSENGCEKVENYTVEAFPDFEVNITGETQICEGETSTLTASGGSQYRWNTNATSPTIQVGTGNYSVTITSESGCEKVVNYTVEEFPDFEVNITGETQICEGETSTLTASGGSQYRWNTNATAPTIQVGAGNYNVTITSENGCEKVANYIVEEFPDFEVNITGETQICAGETSTLTASGGSQYRWNTNATAPTIQVGAGNYNVTITSENGCEKVANYTVEAFPDFEVNITGETQICEGEISTLTASGGSQYRWNTNATSSSIQVDAGNYSVTITNENGCEKIANYIVEEFPNFEVEITGENAVCEGENTSLTARSGQSYLWSNGATTQIIEVGIGTYTVTVTNENNCQATQEIRVSQLALPTLSISSSATCANTLRTYEIDFITENENDINISNGRLIEGANGLFRIIEIPVEEDLILIITNEFGCSISEIIEAPECECPSIAAPVSNGDLTICEGEELPTLSVSASGEDITINWYDAPSDGNLLLEASPEFAPTEAGTYYAEAISNISGCVSDARIALMLTINSLPQITVSDLITIDCNNNTGSILVEGSGGIAPYEFALGEGAFQVENLFDELEVGDYTIFIRDANTCSNQTSVNIDTEIRVDQQQLVQHSCNFVDIGIDTVFLINELGCDSLIITTTLDGRTMPTIFTENTCNRSQIRQDTLFFQNQFGCDSLIITRYNLVASDTTFISGTTCDINLAGERTLNLVNQFGCDSVVVINTIFSDKDVLFINASSCDPTQIGVDTMAFINQLGCDSLIITTTTLQGENDTTFLRVATCDFNSVGIDTIFLSNESACDSIVITDRFFDFPAPPVIEVAGELMACQGDTLMISTNSYETGLQWIKNGEEIEGANSAQLLITESGIYGLSYTNEEGCVVLGSTVTFTFLEAPEVPIFANENNLLTLNNPEAFDGFDLQWFFEGMPIEGANNSTYCSSASGGHSLIATDPSTNCSSAFALFVEYDEDIENCVVNVKNSFEDTVIQVYPNPHRDQFTIELETPQKVKLQVVNLLGQVLYDQQISGQRLHTVSSADWVAGVYYLNTEVDGKMKVVKLIKVD